MVGGGLVSVDVNELDAILLLPEIDKTQIMCRFGDTEVQADETSLFANVVQGVIRCLPPASTVVGQVQLSVSFNKGQYYLQSSTYYTYFCNEIGSHIDPEGSGTCIACPEGAHCNGGPSFYPKTNYWRDSSRALNSVIYSCPFGNGISCMDSSTVAAAADHCGDGYSGPVCAVCTSGYYLTSQGCVACGNTLTTAIVVTVILGALAIGLMSFWLVVACRQQSSRNADGAKSARWFRQQHVLQADAAGQRVGAVGDAGSTVGDWFREQPSSNADDAKSAGWFRQQADPSLELSDRSESDIDSPTECGANVVPLGEEEQPAVENPSYDIDLSAGVTGILTDSAVEVATEAAKTVTDFVTTLKTKLWDSVGQFKILFGVLQIISSFIDSFTVPWPDIFVSWIASIQFVNFGIFDVDSLGCVSPDSNFYTKVQMQVFGPILIGLTIFGVAKLRIWIANQIPASAPASASARSLSENENKANAMGIRIVNQHMFAFFFFLFLIYAGKEHSSPSWVQV